MLAMGEKGGQGRRGVCVSVEGDRHKGSCESGNNSAKFNVLVVVWSAVGRDNTIGGVEVCPALCHESVTVRG